MTSQVIAFKTPEKILSEAAFETYLAAHENKDLLRLLTCGSVDDGKSTLLGRLLYDTQVLFDDQLQALAGDSRRHGTQGDDLDFALLVDGLAAEREQGITIDVAYRFFSTEQRKFIVADCPGHEQYTRNMVTGASTADLAIVLVDARKGILTQTRRHTWIASLLGIRQVVLAVNKMDLVHYDVATFERIAADYRELALKLGISRVAAIPLSALRGDNVSQRSDAMSWYAGPSLLEHLETVEKEAPRAGTGFRLPVQWVCRPDSGFRGYAGEVASGSVRPGDEVVILPSGTRSRVARLVTSQGDLAVATAGTAVNLVLTDERDVSRGDVIAAANTPPAISDRLQAHLVWLDEAPLVIGKTFWLKLGTSCVNAVVRRVVHRVDVNTQAQLAATSLDLNETGLCALELDKPVAIEAYADSSILGAFILIDRETHATVAAGMVTAVTTERRVRWQETEVNAAARAQQKAQQPACLWFTGLSGAGKSTLASRVEKRLHALGKHTYLLDGDNLRHGLNGDLDFAPAARAEAMRRVGETARLMTDAGLIVLVSAISPYRRDRERARQLFPVGDFLEVFVDAPLALCEQRDVKGLYAQARTGKITDFTGIDAPYEAPLTPEVHVHTDQADVDVLVEQVVARLLERD